MLDERKATILRAVVQEYIETSQPVGSSKIAEADGVEVSSATVRNEMATLEDEGYLHQPHTSAGRVPTEKGYRYFVDALTEPSRLDRRQAVQVKQFFDTAHGELEELLESTSRLLSGLTEWTGVVVTPAHADTQIRSVQVVALGPSTVLVVVVLADATVEKYTIDLADDTGEERVNAASVHLATQLVGTMRSAIPSAVLPTGDAATDSVVDTVLARIGSTPANEDSDVFVGGASRVASAFDAVETVQQVLGILEQQFVVVTLLRDVVDRGLQVAIGTETGVEPLAEASLVVAPYTVDGEQLGSIGVLGPTRMNYPQALAAVAAVSRQLGTRLTEG